MLKTIIFDLGGVLIDWNPVKPFIQVFKGDNEKALWFIKNICTHEWNAQTDAGKSFDDAINERVIEFPEFEREIKLYKELWVDMLEGEIPGTVSILEDIHSKKDHKLLAITNWSAETFPVAIERYSFLNLFEDIAVSGELKMIKPGAEIFEYMLKKHALDPTESVFIDDNPMNIETAEKLGFKGILFETPDQLKKDLTELGIHFN